MMRSPRWRMTGPQLSGVVFGLFVVMVIAMLSTRSCSAPPQVEIVIDTVYCDTLPQPRVKMQDPKQKTKKVRREPQKPQSRDYLDERVSE